MDDSFIYREETYCCNQRRVIRRKVIAGVPPADFREFLGEAEVTVNAPQPDGSFATRTFGINFPFIGLSSRATKGDPKVALTGCFACYDEVAETAKKDTADAFVRHIHEAAVAAAAEEKAEEKAKGPAIEIPTHELLTERHVNQDGTEAAAPPKRRSLFES